MRAEVTGELTCIIIIQTDTLNINTILRSPTGAE